MEWRAVDDRKEETVPPLVEAAQSYFEWEREQVLSFLATKERAWQQRLQVDIAIEDLLDVVEAAQRLISEIEPHMIDAIREGFRAGRLRINADGPPFDADRPGARQVVNEVAELLSNVPKTSRGRLGDIILKGYEDGKDLATVTDEVQQLYNGTSGSQAGGTDGGGTDAGSTDGGDSGTSGGGPGGGTQGMTQARAETIARTTSTAAFEAGQYDAFQANGIAAREWLTTRDGRQRPGHGEANGQRKPIGDPFEVRADTDKPFEQLRYPGDPSASAENVVRCRCTTLPSFGDDQDADTSPIAGVVETDGPS